MIRLLTSNLSRYLLRQNLFLLLLCLGAGIGVYLLIDIFDRVDNFLQAEVPTGIMATYFAAKIPLIISQVLPMVFLLAMVVQLGILFRNRELLALQAGGQSTWRAASFFLVYALAASLVQLAFSEHLGVKGLEITSRIWKEDVRDSGSHGMIRNLWFTEGRRIVRLGKALPAEGRAWDVEIYELAPDEPKVTDFIAARRLEVQNGQWMLHDVDELDPVTFATAEHVRMAVDMERSLDAYESVNPKVNPAQLPLWRLSWVIQELKASGSNVEGLLTAWHMKWSYAFSIFTLALAALAFFSLTGNVYVNVFGSMILAFIFYGMHVVGGTAGDQGMLPPWAAAWMGNAVISGLAVLRLLWYYRPRRGVPLRIRAPAR